MNEHSSAEQLLRAVTFFRNSSRAPDQEGLDASSACAILHHAVRDITSRTCASFEAQLGNAAIQDAIDWTMDQCRSGLCRADHPGEAVAFVSMVARNRLRAELRRQRAIPDQVDRVASNTDPEQALEGADQVACLSRACQRVLALMVIHGRHRRVARAHAFIQYRMQSSTHVLTRASRDRIYQDRCVGRRYVADTVKEHRHRFSEEELEMLERLLSTPELSDAGCLEHPEQEDAS